MKMGERVKTHHGWAVVVMVGYDEKNRLVEIVLEME